MVIAWLAVGTVLAVEIRGTVVCGYQGWFRTPGDGSGMGWSHYGAGGRFEPGACSIDLWPDVSELPIGARVDTRFRHTDGSVAQVFSSLSAEVSDLHFRWMREYGIDGVFFQRFAVTALDPRARDAMDGVLRNGIRAAGGNGRCWGLMYDLTGLRPGRAESVIEDWRRIRREFGIGDPDRNPNRLEHRGRPLVALWGLGFSDRDPMWDDWRELLRFFGESEGFAVLVGVPTFWRDLDRDAVGDATLHDLISQADIVSPWTVGRYRAPEQAERHIAGRFAADAKWCRERGLDYLPVCFPGFSWQNLEKARGRSARLDDIPRLGGRFFWSQVRANHREGAEMLYVAMFDELDEATAIMKWNNDPPVGGSVFLREDGVPTDRYLRLTGEAVRLMRGAEVEEIDGLPAGVVEAGRDVQGTPEQDEK